VLLFYRSSHRYEATRDDQAVLRMRIASEAAPPASPQTLAGTFRTVENASLSSMNFVSPNVRPLGAGDHKLPPACLAIQSAVPQELPESVYSLREDKPGQSVWKLKFAENGTCSAGLT
jgi:hypothetical protein